MTTLCLKQTIQEISKEHVDFGMRDGKGRSLGMRVAVRLVEFTPSDGTFGYRTEPGVYFEVSASTTRSGDDYGASSGRPCFATKAEAEAYGAKRIKAAKSRAAKVAVVTR